MSRNRKRRRAALAFEPRHAPLLPRWQFYQRVARLGSIALGILASALFLGALGFRATERLSWLDSTLNASMLLSGMGPVDRPLTDGGKVFATVYALFSGIVFLTVAALLLAPIFHRLLHRFHLELDAESRRERE